MAIPLTAHEATITTATVEIRQLRVSGKQVTLAVFRQLEAEGIIDWDTGSFRGLPWGWVNYHENKKACQSLGDHRHIVWQRGDELRSDTLSRFDLDHHHARTCPYPDAAIDCYAAWLAITPRAHLADLALPIGWHVPVPMNDAETLGYVAFGDVTLRYDLPSPTGQAVAYQAAWEQVEAEHPDIAAFAHRWRERDAAVDAAQRAIMAAHYVTTVTDFLGEGYDATAAAITIAAYVETEQAVMTAQHQRWDEIMALPQLFIAV